MRPTENPHLSNGTASDRSIFHHVQCIQQIARRLLTSVEDIGINRVSKSPSTKLISFKSSNLQHQHCTANQCNWSSVLPRLHPSSDHLRQPCPNTCLVAVKWHQSICRPVNCMKHSLPIKCKFFGHLTWLKHFSWVRYPTGALLWYPTATEPDIKAFWLDQPELETLNLSSPAKLKVL